jgi:hypothetical protein
MSLMGGTSPQYDFYPHRAQADRVSEMNHATDLLLPPISPYDPKGAILRVEYNARHGTCNPVTSLEEAHG